MKYQDNVAAYARRQDEARAARRARVQEGGYSRAFITLAAIALAGLIILLAVHRG